MSYQQFNKKRRVELCDNITNNQIVINEIYKLEQKINQNCNNINIIGNLILEQKQIIKDIKNTIQQNKETLKTIHTELDEIKNIIISNLNNTNNMNNNYNNNNNSNNSNNNNNQMDELDNIQNNYFS